MATPGAMSAGGRNEVLASVHAYTGRDECMLVSAWCRGLRGDVGYSGAAGCYRRRWRRVRV